MTANMTLDAYEAGLITEDEAVEQTLVDDLEQLYQVAATEFVEHGGSPHRTTLEAGMRS